MESSTDKSRLIISTHTSDRRRKCGEVLLRLEALRRLQAGNNMCPSEMVMERQSKAALVPANSIGKAFSIPADVSSQMQQSEKQKHSLNGAPERQCCLHHSTKQKAITLSTGCDTVSVISKKEGKWRDDTVASESHQHEHIVKRKRAQKTSQQSIRKKENHASLRKGISREKHHLHHHHHHHHPYNVPKSRDPKKTTKKIGAVEMICGDPHPASPSAGGRSARMDGLSNISAAAEQHGLLHHKSSQEQIPRRQHEAQELNPIKPTTTSDTLMNHDKALNQERERIRQESDQKAEAQARKQPELPIPSTGTKERDDVSDRLKKELANELIRLPKVPENLGSYQDADGETSKEVESLKRPINGKADGVSRSGASRPTIRNSETEQDSETDQGGGKHDQVGGRGQVSQHTHKVLVGPLHKRSRPRYRPTRHDDPPSFTPSESLSTSIRQELETESESAVSWVPAGRRPRKDRCQPLPSQMQHRTIAKRHWSVNMPHRLPHQHPRWTPDTCLSPREPRKPISGSHQAAQFALATTEQLTRDKKMFKSNGKKMEKKNESDTDSGNSVDAGALRKYKNRLGLIFHHHHHHHHHVHPRDQDEEHHRYYGHLLRGLFHLGRNKEPAGILGQMKGKKVGDQKLLVKKGHGHLYRLLAAFLGHILHPRKAAAGRKQAARMMVAGGKQVKKLHWWQKIYRRGGVRLANRKKPQLRLPFRMNSHKTKALGKH
ncbi:unnamed protein product [Victoria cruziana]